MEKKFYEKPQMNIAELELEGQVLIGSGDSNTESYNLSDWNIFA